MSHISVSVTPSQAEGLPLGAVVEIMVRGRVIGLDSQPGPGPDEDEEVRLSVDGEATVQPGSMDSVAREVIRKLANDKTPQDFPIGQRELHAP